MLAQTKSEDMYKILVTCLLLASRAAYADKYSITATGELESDPGSKQRELFIEFKQEDELKRYENDITLNIDHAYARDNESGEFVKNRELFDYEQNFKLFRNKSEFFPIYGRFREDNFQNLSSQNYTILSVGYGRESQIGKEHKGELNWQISLGQRRSSAGNIAILRPEISYTQTINDFTYEVEASMVRGASFTIRDTEFSIAYPLTKKLSIKYLFRYEISEDKNGDDFDRLNQLALSVNF